MQSKEEKAKDAFSNSSHISMQISQDEINNQDDKSKKYQYEKTPVKTNPTTENEKNGDEKEKELPKLKPVSLKKLYSFAGKKEVLLMILGIIGSMCYGLCMPALAFMIGEMMESFKPDITPDEMVETMGDTALLIFFVSVALFCTAFMMECFWIQVGERVSLEYRKVYLQELMKKSVTWFDLNKPQELPTVVSTNCDKIQTALGEKVGQVLSICTLTVAGIICGFIFGWQLALCFLLLFPVASLGFLALNKGFKGAEVAINEAYKLAGGFAEEVFSNIRTVYAFCAEKIEGIKYSKELVKMKKAAKKKGSYIGLGLGILNFGIDLTYAIGFFIGSYFIEERVINHLTGEDYKCSDVLKVFFTVTMGFFSLGQFAPHFNAIMEGRFAAAHLFKIMDETKEAVDDVSEEGTIKISDDDYKGNIEFKEVEFCFPSRKEVKILKKLNLNIVGGNTTAICGETGSGKSTIVQLLERFYKVEAGQILVDGYDLYSLNKQWFRSTIGYVSQEPVLFNTTIRENILYGNESATEEQIIEACKKTNCYDFIQSLPDKFQTRVGLDGGQLSGGQKQRIAIARAIIRNPRILILDEATSALDRKCEQEVNDALQELFKHKITTIVIAHRLTTIQNADKIVAIHQGEVKEEGSHDDLLEIGGLYSALYNIQLKKDEQKKIIERKMTDKDDEAIQKIIEKRKDRLMSGDGLKKQESEIITLQALVKQEESEKKREEEEEKKISKSIIKMVWEKQDKKLVIVFGTIFSFINGAHMPLCGYIFGKILNDLLIIDMDEMRDKINWDFGFMIILGVLTGIFTFLSTLLFEYSGCDVEQELRKQLYAKMLSMQVGWFDDAKHSPSQLCSVLFDDVNKFNDFIKLVAGNVIGSVSAVITSLIIGFSYDWRITLVVLGLFPLVVIGGSLEVKINMGYTKKNEEMYRIALEILSEGAKNFRTVVAFNNQEKIKKLYNTSLDEPRKKITSKAVISGLCFGLSQCMPNNLYSIAFYVGSIFIREYGLNSQDVFVAVFSLFFGAYYLGIAQQFAPDISKAKRAVINITKILQTESKILVSGGGKKPEIKGKIEFSHVYFKYPNRNEWVLKDFSFIVNPSTKMALVGTSGSGKSTVIQLIERFYDANFGSIYIDGVDIKDIDLHYLRTKISLVLQEPRLFDDTIKSNIQYGHPEASFEEIKEAATRAHAIGFIEDSQSIDKNTANKEKNNDVGVGFERRVGQKGSQLSGGQKQRIAIARAILGNPSILLFDEATSALDRETEEMVQRAINEVSQSRTSIVVAHRISTIQDSECIFVLQNGMVVEEGTHEYLLSLKNHYFKLVQGTTE